MPESPLKESVIGTDHVDSDTIQNVKESDNNNNIVSESEHLESNDHVSKSVTAPVTESVSTSKIEETGSKNSVTKDSLLRKRKNQLNTMVNEIGALSFVKPYTTQYGDQLTQFFVFTELTLIPLLGQFCAFSSTVFTTKIQPLISGENSNQNMKDLVPAICGLLLCVFGGTFPLIIASVEAFRLVGYQGVKKAIMDLYVEATKALAAHKKDEEEDLDGDGIPDVEQIDSKQLFTRKFLLIVRVVDPESLSTAITSLNCGLLAVLANLKMSFARAITLGATLGGIIKDQTNSKIRPTIEETVPKEYHKWIPIVIDYVTKFIAVMIAFSLQTIISAFHSAVRGGHIAAEYGYRYGCRTGKLGLKGTSDSSSCVDEKMITNVGYGLAAVGFLFQLWMGFGLMFPFSILLLPVTLVEWFLSIMVTWF